MESAITAYISNKKILFHIFYFDDLLFEVQYKAMLSIYYMNFVYNLSLHDDGNIWTFFALFFVL